MRYFLFIIFLCFIISSCKDETIAPVDQGRAPSPPTALTIEEGEEVLTLDWFPPNDPGTSPVSAYNIYRSQSPGTGTFYDQISSDSLTYTDSTDVDTVYYYYISAINLTGESPASNEVFGSSFEPAPGRSHEVNK